jgi:hypothetical protein
MTNAVADFLLRRAALWLVGLAVAVVLVVIKTGWRSSPPPAPTVSIQRVEPSGDIPLVAGDSATFRVTARAQNVGEGYWIGLVVQADGVVLGNASPVSASDGEEVTLQTAVRVPNSASVQVFTPLFREGQSETRRMDARLFKVVGMRGSEK